MASEIKSRECCLRGYPNCSLSIACRNRREDKGPIEGLAVMLREINNNSSHSLCSASNLLEWLLFGKVVMFNEFVQIIFIEAAHTIKDIQGDRGFEKCFETRCWSGNPMRILKEHLAVMEESD